MNNKVFSYAGMFVLALASTTAALAGSLQYSVKSPAIDLGSAHRFEGDVQVTVTIALKSRNADEMQALLKSMYTPGDPNFRRFLSTEEFSAKFGPAPQTIDLVTHHLQAAGLDVERASVAHLRVSGSMTAIEREFGVSFHTFEVPATAARAAYRFRAPAGAAQLSSAIAGEVDAVVGLDNRPRFHPMLRRTKLQHAPRAASTAPNTPNPPGDWTVVDLAQYYDVTPLYKHGISGAGRTIGIVTLAAFTPSDAFAYWASLALQVDPHRIKVVNIDGGPGAPSDASGSDETTLDVEQSGGLAPGAKIVVYQAPNTDQGFLDAFARAIHDNNADAISTSWGEWEEFLVQGTAISDPSAAGQLRAYDNLFIQAALQGQSLSAAAGDSGSYDMDGEISPVNDVLSVDHPASDPYILAAGGTTLPGPQQFLLNDGSTVTVNVAQERAWSWDYLNGLCAMLGFDPVSCGIFPVGGGGGVSVVFPVPFYQNGVDGIRSSEPKQVLFDLSQTPPQKLLTLPARFAGRNVPDISLNADPDTGYIAYYTSDVSGFGIDDFWGGTSFCAPQLAGITTLIDQDVGGRVGLLNFALYEIASRGQAYTGANPPLRDIRKGDNEFYNAGPGYDQASGLGVLDVANLAEQFH
jgi:kumamolisin